MSEQFIIEAQSRQDVGKGASRRLRRTGKVPGVVYGGHKAPQSITVDQNTIVHQLENESFYSSILDLNVEGRREQVILRDLQRHPFKPSILHMDLQRVSADEAIRVNMPIHFLNEDDCVGVKQEGGMLNRNVNELEISCLPKDLPSYIEVDVGNLHLGDSLHLSDITLPEGVEVVVHAQGGEEEEHHDLLLVTVTHAQKAEDDEADETDGDESEDADESSDD